MKNPIVIAVLNFIFIGLGTMLLGKRVAYGLLGFIGGGILLRYEELRMAPLLSGVFNIHWVPMIIGITLLGIGTAIDGYREAKQA